MTKKYLSQGVVVNYPGKNANNFDLENYIISVLGKTTTCCLKEVIATSLSTDTIAEATAAAGVTIDGALIKDGGISANSMYAAFYPTAAAQALSGAGAVNVTSFLTKFTSTGAAQALTIASGTQIGQRKKVYHVVDGGSGVLTGVFVGGTTITFTTAGEIAELMWTGASWAVLELTNTTAGGAVPALA
jgi:hypothetical protein